MKRRDVLKRIGLGAGAIGLSRTLAGCSDRSPSSSAPNVLFLMVDEMRYPRHFPAGVTSADEFIEKFMPNLWSNVWRDGVVFTNHRTSASACTPSRAALFTGLHTQQTWILQTVAGAASPDPPDSLQAQFPTLGHLMRTAGRATPYFGKFHITSTGPYDPGGCPAAGNFLEPYGFTAMTCPDMVGNAGTGDSCGGTCYGDAQIADAAVDWISSDEPLAAPFCATLSFVNPHDREYFWAGTEAFIYMPLFENAGQTPIRSYDPSFVGEANPAPQGFAPVPSNWQTFEELRATKPRSQLTWNEAHQTAFGAPSFDTGVSDFFLTRSLAAAGQLYKAIAPFAYWQRGQDSYVQVMQMVDEQIGRVFDAMPDDVKENLVVVFAADHGEYSGSHGFDAGKEGTAYEEILNIPLVVRDYTGRFARDVGVRRTQITSSVDVLNLLVTLGYGGSTEWITGDLVPLYGGRLNLLDVVESPSAAGRDYHLFTTDELLADVLNFNVAPLNVVSMVTNEAKVAVYSFWEPGSTVPSTEGRLLEFYDYSTEGGRLETVSTPEDARAREMGRPADERAAAGADPPAAAAFAARGAEPRGAAVARVPPVVDAAHAGRPPPPARLPTSPGRLRCEDQPASAIIPPSTSR